jgi:chemotaxis protein methyltransferase CheR
MVRPLRTETDFKNKEFPFTDKDFNYIRDLVADRTGIVLSDIKRDMVYSRVVRRIRKLQNIDNFTEYCSLLKNGDEHEMVEFTNAITTNLTSFFREPHHFEYLTKTLLPELKAKKRDRKIRVWSAGCSSGEEPYSIAMTLRDFFPHNSGWDIRILATDLDSHMVDNASKGVYKEERVTGIDKKHLRKWVRRGKGAMEGNVKISNELQEMITFKQLNLMHDWPIKGPFDFMFCRNVVIYFNKETQKELFDRYAELLVPEAGLFIGHSESLHNVTDRFKSLGKTIYRKIK